MSSPKTAITIGNFDGVHRGHQTLVNKIQAYRASHSENNIRTCVVTFDPHPIEVLRPKVKLLKISTTDERVKLLKKLGIDEVKVIKFTSGFATTSAHDFFNNHLLADLNPAYIVVGHNFYFGHNREGNPQKVLEWSSQRGIEAEIVSPIQSDGEEISSSRIRALLKNGLVQGASRLLGRDYSFTGQVIHGQKKGRSIGVPTANLSVPDDRCVPKNGVYLSVTSTEDGQTFPSITNVGIKPTIEPLSDQIYIETHLLNFDADLYEKLITVEFRDRLRDEIRFPSLEALRLQIQADIQTARSRLGNN